MKFRDGISIIVTVYNKEQFISKTLETISKQMSENSQLIIINDGSTDKSELVIKKFIKSQNKDIEILKSYNIDYLFLPEKKDMISVVDNFNYKLPTFANILCGKYRDLHFLGVVQIVKKLFDIIKIFIINKSP